MANRHPALGYHWSMMFYETRYPLFGIMLEKSARIAAVAVRDPGGERRVDPAQLGEGFLGFRELALEPSDLLQAFLPAELEGVARRLAAVGCDHFADFGKREAELLGLDDHREPIGVLAPVATGVSLAAGIEQTAALVKPQRTQAYIEPPGQISDRIDRLIPARVAGVSGALHPKNVVGAGKQLRRIVTAHSYSSCWRPAAGEFRDISVTFARKRKKCARSEQ